MTAQECSLTTLEAVSDILSQAPPIAACHLRPHPACCLFISWNGCIVLVYDGFPPPLVQAKMRITNNNDVMLRLKEENFGSKWPKTTLGAVNDGADELSLEQFTRLRDICNRYSNQIINNISTNNGIKVDILSIVEYQQRGLEKLSKRIDVPLDDPTTKSCNDVDEDSSSNSTPSEEEQSRVNSVISEWNDVQAYLPKVNAPGSRIESYRQDFCGRTCVAFIISTMPAPLRDVLSEFRHAVDEEFPGRYGWLDETSLHCTLRSLDEYAKGI
ncbi:hypothetical protein QTG54_009317 [Skeletonema marinoi]|uniref:Uncharacterized protein n=1 Tax=Skeletonema marinoi TaxID=267567 RepID=A0AAD9DAN9_9STRA|nr:hypothetical protein QTG54_009317 [Skeletonema marinoi]